MDHHEWIFVSCRKATWARGIWRWKQTETTDCVAWRSIGDLGMKKCQPQLLTIPPIIILAEPGGWKIRVYVNSLGGKSIDRYIYNIYIYMLVGGLEHECYDFPFSWECHIITEELTPSFFRGLGEKPPTR